MTPNQLKKIKKKLGWTNRKLADEIGVGERIVYYWLAGKRRIPLTVEKILALMVR